MQVWDTVTGHLKSEPKKRVNVRAAVFLPDGRRIFSCSLDRTLRLWQTTTNSTGEQKDTVFGAHLDSALCVAVSPDGTTLASGGIDGSVKLWHVPSFQGNRPSETVTEFKAWAGIRPWANLHTLLPVPNTNRLLVVTGFGTELRDLSSGQQLATWPDASGCGAISPDGKLLATGTMDGKLNLWNMADGSRLASVQAHPEHYTGYMVQLAFSPDSRFLATGGQNGDTSIKLWDTSAPLKLLRQIPTAFSSGTRALAISPDGKTLAVAMMNERVLLLDVASGQPEQFIHVGNGQILTTVFSPDGKLLAMAREGGMIALWDLQAGELRVTLRGHTSSPNVLAFSPDSATLASGSDDYTVRLWDVATGQERIAFKDSADPVAGVAFSPDGRMLITGHRNGLVKIRHGNHVPEADVEVPPVNATGGMSPWDYNAMAWTLAASSDPNLRNGKKALKFAEMAVTATKRNDPGYLDTLAAAYAELGQFTNAVRVQQEAILLLKDDGTKRDYLSHLNLYQSNTPCRIQP